jgi:hypothetical protein
MPLHPVALEVLKQTGPMAVSSANRTGSPPATTADEAERQLGEAVSIYLDAGPCADSVPSTILDLTGAIPRVLREGAIPVDRLRTVASIITDTEPYVPEPEFPAAAEPGTEPGAEPRAEAEKPAMPHPLERPVDPAGAVTDEPPSAGG